MILHEIEVLLMTTQKICTVW